MTWPPSATRRERVVTPGSGPTPARCDGGGGGAVCGLRRARNVRPSAATPPCPSCRLRVSDEGGGAARQASPGHPGALGRFPVLREDDHQVWRDLRPERGIEGRSGRRTRSIPGARPPRPCGGRHRARPHAPVRGWGRATIWPFAWSSTMTWGGTALWLPMGSDEDATRHRVQTDVDRLQRGVDRSTEASSWGRLTPSSRTVASAAMPTPSAPRLVRVA